MIRHTVLFAWSPQTVAEQRLRVKEGLAYVSFGSDILALDFGENLEGGRTTDYGLALIHDHATRARWDAYNEDAHHHRVGEYIKTVTRPEVVARVDWEYHGPPSVKGMIRYTVLYKWRDGVTEAARRDVVESLTELGDRCPTLQAIAYGNDLGWYPPNHDWIVEAHFADFEGLLAFLADDAHREVDAAVASLVDDDATARIQHRMMSG